jgi:hypothetical protein
MTTRDDELRAKVEASIQEVQAQHEAERRRRADEAGRLDRAKREIESAAAQAAQRLEAVARTFPHAFAYTGPGNTSGKLTYRLEWTGGGEKRALLVEGVPAAERLSWKWESGSGWNDLHVPLDMDQIERAVHLLAEQRHWARGGYPELPRTSRA